MHKFGRIHFHGIGTNCDKLKLTDSEKSRKGKKIHNISSRSSKYGFTTVSKIEDAEKGSSYIMKYITKELITATKGKHRYLYSKNLNVPTVENVVLEDNPKVYYSKVYVNEETEQEKFMYK